MKILSIINNVLIIVGTIVLLSGIRLHIGYPALQQDHQQMLLWMLTHIIAACVLIVVVGFHIFYNRWWFKSLKIKIKTPKVLLQRIFTPLVVLTILALLITGLMMLCGWYPHHSHIWIWHYVIGLVWAVLVVCHGSLFFRKKKKKTKTHPINN